METTHPKKNKARRGGERHRARDPVHRVCGRGAVREAERGHIGPGADAEPGAPRFRAAAARAGAGAGLRGVLPHRGLRRGDEDFSINVKIMLAI